MLLFFDITIYNNSLYRKTDNPTEIAYNYIVLKLITSEIMVVFDHGYLQTPYIYSFYGSFNGVLYMSIE